MSPRNARSRDSSQTPITGRSTYNFPNSVDGSTASWMPMFSHTEKFSRVQAVRESTDSWKPVRLSGISPKTPVTTREAEIGSPWYSWRSSRPVLDIEWSSPFEGDHAATAAQMDAWDELARPVPSGTNEAPHRASRPQTAKTYGSKTTRWTQADVSIAPHTPMPEVPFSNVPVVVAQPKVPTEPSASKRSLWPRRMSQYHGSGVQPVSSLAGTPVGNPQIAEAASKRILPVIPGKKRGRRALPLTAEPSGGPVAVVVKRRFMLFNLYLIFRPYFTAFAAIAAAVIIVLAQQRSASQLGGIIIANKRLFRPTRLPLIVFQSNEVRLGLDGYCVDDR